MQVLHSFTLNDSPYLCRLTDSFRFYEKKLKEPRTVSGLLDLWGVCVCGVLRSSIMLVQTY